MNLKYLETFLFDMVHKCLLIVEVVRNVGNSKRQLLQSLIMKVASILLLPSCIIKVGNVLWMQWPIVIGPIPGRMNSDNEAVFRVEYILGWSRSSNIT